MKKLLPLAIGALLTISAHPLWAQAPVRGEVPKSVVAPAQENQIKALFSAIELASNSQDLHDVKRVYYFKDKNEEARFEAAFRADDLTLKFGSPYTLSVERSLGSHFYDDGKRMILFVEKSIVSPSRPETRLHDAAYFIHVDGQWRLDWEREARYLKHENLSDNATSAAYRGEITQRIRELETNFNEQRLMPILNRVYFEQKPNSPEFAEAYGKLGTAILDRLSDVKAMEKEFTLKVSDIEFSDERAFFTLNIIFKRADREAPTEDDLITLKRSMVKRDGEWFFTPAFFTQI